MTDNEKKELRKIRDKGLDALTNGSDADIEYALRDVCVSLLTLILAEVDGGDDQQCSRCGIMKAPECYNAHITMCDDCWDRRKVTALVEREP